MYKLPIEKSKGPWKKGKKQKGLDKRSKIVEKIAEKTLAGEYSKRLLNYIAGMYGTEMAHDVAMTALYTDYTHNKYAKTNHEDFPGLVKKMIAANNKD